MRKLRLTFLAVVLMVATVASAQFYFGVQGGINWSDFSVENRGQIDERRSFGFVGFNVGLLAEYILSENRSIKSGLSFTTKRPEVVHLTQNRTESPETIFNLQYVQVPVNYVFRMKMLARGRRGGPIHSAVIFYGGPYFAYGVGGIKRIDDERVGNGFHVFGNDAEQLKRFDFGLNLGIGKELGHFLVRFGRYMGLANVSNRDDIRVRNRNSTITVGYRF